MKTQVLTPICMQPLVLFTGQVAVHTRGLMLAQSPSLTMLTHWQSIAIFVMIPAEIITTKTATHSERVNSYKVNGGNAKTTNAFWSIDQNKHTLRSGTPSAIPSMMNHVRLEI